jgi:putative nucleotide binding protein
MIISIRRATTSKEEWGIVLDYLPHGHAFSNDRNPVAQIVGEKNFTLLEVIPKKEIALKVGDRVYIGPDKRDEIHHVVGRIDVSKLTNMAKDELERILKKGVKDREKEFVDFFNKASGITTRLHEFEILPGVGRKHMWKLIEERKKEPFKSFTDIKKRIRLMPDPKKVIIKRIMNELERKDKYKIFTN